MAGHRKFSELTQKFTPEDRRKTEELKAEMRAVIKSESAKRNQNDKEAA